jgi:hypothetical protein
MIQFLMLLFGGILQMVFTVKDFTHIPLAMWRLG